MLNLLIMWSLCGISHTTLPKEKDNGNNKKKEREEYKNQEGCN